MFSFVFEKEENKCYLKLYYKILTFQNFQSPFESHDF